jgi:hypothetical protein
MRVHFQQLAVGKKLLPAVFSFLPFFLKKKEKEKEKLHGNPSRRSRSFPMLPVLYLTLNLCSLYQIDRQKTLRLKDDPFSM